MKSKRFIILFIVIGCSFLTLGQNVVFTEIPLNLQLYPRDNQDSSEVAISGQVQTLGYDTIRIEIFKNDQLLNTHKSYLNYQGSVALFSFRPKIYAEQSEYDFKIYLDNTLITQRDSIVSGDVYLINGQSNALAIDYDGLATYKNEWLRSFGNSSPGSATDTTWGLAQGHEYFTNFAIGVWGVRLGQLLVENHNVPICLISQATAGSQISLHLRNDANPTDLGTNYGSLLYRTIKSKLKDRVKGILWNQGESDTEQTVSAYENNFDDLYNDWKSDFPGLEMIYTFQIRPCSQGSRQRQLRNKQRLLAEQYPDVQIMSTVGLPGHDGLHYHYDGYKMMGEWIYRLVARDFYNSTDTLSISPPKIQNIFYSTSSQNEIIMVFDQPVTWPDDTLGASMKDYIYLVGDTLGTIIDSGFVQNGDSVVLQLSGTSSAIEITYIPNSTYNGTSTIYEGPWIKNTRGVGALTFYRFPISDLTLIRNQSPATSDQFWLKPNYPNPFNPKTQISFKIPNRTYLKLLVYNSKGEKVRELINDFIKSGNYSVDFDGSNLSSGVYFYVLSTDNYFVCKKMILLK